MMEVALYLLPVTLGETPVENVLPVYNKEVILGIKHFIVEDVRSARRFLKKVDRGIDIDALTFYPLNKHTSPEDISGYLKPLLAGQSMGVISEAGCPAVADPGADVVAIAQRKNLKVVPLVGPSSIIMSVMGSGLMDKVLLFMVICLLSLVSVQNVLRYWSSVFMQKIRRSFLLKLLIVIIRWWKIFLRIAVRKPNFVLLPILRVKENISRLRQ